jgi:hypothetical protein
VAFQLPEKEMKDRVALYRNSLLSLVNPLGTPQRKRFEPLHEHDLWSHSRAALITLVKGDCLLQKIR